MKKIATILISLALASVSFASPNLIVNGDFGLGNTGFDTDYYFSPPASMYDPGTYVVGTNPQNYHGSWASYGDHPSGSGNMLIVNAATVADVTVWEQTVTVTTNTDYVFTYWLSSCYPTNLANLQCSINGTAIGTQVAPSTVAVWEEVSYNWNSEASTSATINLEDLTREYSGDDFAIDDISFCATVIYVDIDIKPGSYPNAINLTSRGLTPVVIFSELGVFNATSVDPNTVELSGALVARRGKGGEKFMAHEEDIGGDAALDLVVQVATADIDPSLLVPVEEDGVTYLYAVLTGTTYGGEDIEGWDEVTIVPPDK